MPAPPYSRQDTLYARYLLLSLSRLIKTAYIVIIMVISQLLSYVPGRELFLNLVFHTNWSRKKAVTFRCLT